MKITPDHLDILRAALAPLDTPALRELYINRTFSNADKVKDVNKRYRWDLLYMSKLKIGDGVGIKGDLDLYAYMDDTHIDTALRAIIPDVVGEFAGIKRPVPPKTSSPIHDPWGLGKLD
jgi:hypothetical protein